ncbi:MAG: hypothetical protein LBR31_09965 [Desulfovibrio sp.]|nr:hypothetical protein [Desulfovibrio sp.]
MRKGEAEAAAEENGGGEGDADAPTGAALLKKAAGRGAVPGQAEDGLAAGAARAAAPEDGEEAYAVEDGLAEKDGILLNGEADGLLGNDWPLAPPGKAGLAVAPARAPGAEKGACAAGFAPVKDAPAAAVAKEDDACGAAGDVCADDGVPAA